MMSIECHLHCNSSLLDPPPLPSHNTNTNTNHSFNQIIPPPCKEELQEGGGFHSHIDCDEPRHIKLEGEAIIEEYDQNVDLAPPLLHESMDYANNGGNSIISKEEVDQEEEERDGDQREREEEDAMASYEELSMHLESIRGDPDLPILPPSNPDDIFATIPSANQAMTMNGGGPLVLMGDLFSPGDSFANEFRLPHYSYNDKYPLKRREASAEEGGLLSGYHRRCQENMMHQCSTAAATAFVSHNHEIKASVRPSSSCSSSSSSSSSSCSSSSSSSSSTVTTTTTTTSSSTMVVGSRRFISQHQHRTLLRQSLAPPPYLQYPDPDPASSMPSYFPGAVSLAMGEEGQGFCVAEDNLVFQLQKELKPSDVGNLGRIVLPKKDAEAKLPYLIAKEGMIIPMLDMASSLIWNFRFRFWPNNKSRMYLLENTRDFVKFHQLNEGDFIVIYTDRSGKYVINARKLTQSGSRTSLGAGMSERGKQHSTIRSNNHGLCKMAVNKDTVKIQRQQQQQQHNLASYSQNTILLQEEEEEECYMELSPSMVEKTSPTTITMIENRIHGSNDFFIHQFK